MNPVLPEELVHSTMKLLYERLSKQLSAFEKSLLATDVYTVLEKAGEYVAKRDILTAFEDANLTPRELLALVTVPDLLNRFYSHWAQRNDLTSDMSDLVKAIRLFSYQRSKEKHQVR